MAYEARQYVVFDTAELNLIDFATVLETSAETVRISTDGTKTFVKWDGDVPACIGQLMTKSDPMTHTEILEMLSGPEWSAPEDMPGV